jgi:hypothetical protein
MATGKFVLAQRRVLPGWKNLKSPEARADERGEPRRTPGDQSACGREMNGYELNARGAETHDFVIKPVRDRLN